MTDQQLVPGCLGDVSPGAKLVYLALQGARGALTAAELAERTGLAASSMPRCLEDLQAAGVEIECVRGVDDPRRKRYALVNEGGLEPGDGV